MRTAAMPTRTSPSDAMKRLLLLALAAVPAACGLVEDDRDERNRNSYITFTDENFEAFCLESFDLNGDGRVSRYEAQRILQMECPQRGIRSLWDLREFTRLETLDCSGNDLTELDLRVCPALVRVDCGGNGLQRLDIDGLRSLRELECPSNVLTQLDLQSNASLGRLVCRDNRLLVLDVSACASRMEVVAAGNPSLTHLYVASGQEVNYTIDGQTVVETIGN